MPHSAPSRPVLDASRLARWVRVAARILATPGAGLEIDQRVVARFGDMPFEDGPSPFCSLTAHAPDGLMVIPDARKDARFARHAAVGKGLVCYAGAALRDAEGQIRGTLFALDRRMRRLSEQDLDDLAQLAALAAEALFGADGASALTQRERERWASEITRAETDLLALERMKAEFVNTASHELRTPLTAILGYSEFLEDCLLGPLNEEQQRFVGEIQDNAKRLQHVVDHMLDLGSLEARTFQLLPTRTDLRQLIRAEISALTPQAATAGVTLAAELPGEPLELSLDAQRVSQVLLQLIDNAIKFTPAGGAIRVNAASETGRVRVVIRDDGIGIPADALPWLFSKFYQVDAGLTRPRNGAGLGLAISRALIEAHRGTIGVESEPGTGTTFWFTLPLDGH